MQLTAACHALKQLKNCCVMAQSRWHLSKPWGPVQQADFLNGVIALDTSLTAHALLIQLQIIEQAQGRVRKQRWGPRTLDLDLLLYGDTVIQSPQLTLPHPEIKHRSFVLETAYRDCA